MKRNLLGALIATAIFASVVFIFHLYPYLVGALEAHLDVLRGKYVIRMGGRVAAERDEYKPMVREEITINQRAEWKKILGSCRH